MFWGISPLVFLLVSFAGAPTRGDTDCDLREDCTLPCSFQAGDEVVIHWIQEELIKAPAHSYYYKKDQPALQHQRFRGRTALFLDQLSRGNASLKLTKVVFEDAGRYKCYTSTTNGHNQQFIQLHVNAPILNVSVDRTENRFTCSSEGIYPEPQLTWSTEPPSAVPLQPQPNTTVWQSPQKLYTISSSLTLSGEDLNVSCTVQTRKHKKKTTLMKYSNQDTDNETKLSCALPATPRTNLIWRFNQSEIILSQDSDRDPVVSDKWKQHVELSESGSLILKELTLAEEGIYTCEASNSEETLRSDTLLSIKQNPTEIPQPGNPGAIIGAVFGVLAVLLVGSFVGFRVWQSQKKNKDVMEPVATEEAHSTTSRGVLLQTSTLLTTSAEPDPEENAV